MRAVLAPGNHIEIQSGNVIGSAGFGYVPTKEGHRRLPSRARWWIEITRGDRLNCCIDRALDETVTTHAGIEDR